MRLSHFLFIFAITAVIGTSNLRAQGMLLDSIMPRIATELHDPTLAEELRTLVPDFASEKVWGLAIGDFTNDSLPDLALSLYNANREKNAVHVYLFENQKGKHLVSRFDRSIAYIESPIEVGLSVEGSVVTVTQKTSDEHWLTEGYSIESGDVVLIDRFETEKEDVTGGAKVKARSIGHDIYRNYENLRTRESYYTGASGDALFKTSYSTLPSYQRLREIYPGYGHLLADTSAEYIVQGVGLRRDWRDLSIRGIQTAYNNDYLYIAVRVNDDYIIGGQQKTEANDRVSFWFDTKYTGDRRDRDRRLLSREGGFPTFRDALDSLVTNITFAVPARPGKVTQVTYSSTSPLTALQQEGLKSVAGQMSIDTMNGATSGYTLSLRIPFSFLNFETNPARSYETPLPQHALDEGTTEGSVALAGIGEAATLGFTTLVYDIDDPAHPNEVTIEATSKYEPGNPSSFGTLVLEPSTLYYGDVHPTYLQQLRSQLAAAGY